MIGQLRIVNASQFWGRPLSKKTNLRLVLAIEVGGHEPVIVRTEYRGLICGEY